MNAENESKSFLQQWKHRLFSLWNLLFVEKTNHAGIQLFRYTFVGGTAFLFDFSTLYILTHFFQFHYLTSAALGFCLGITINYFLSIYWVFKNRSVSDRKLEFIIFGVIGLIGLGLNELIIWIFTDFIKTHYLVSKMISTVIIYLFNFGMRKFALFR